MKQLFVLVLAAIAMCIAVTGCGPRVVVARPAYSTGYGYSPPVIVHTGGMYRQPVIIHHYSSPVIVHHYGGGYGGGYAPRTHVYVGHSYAPRTVIHTGSSFGRSGSFGRRR